MPSNEEAARLLREIADLLDVRGERFKPEAYRRAARSIEGLGEEVAAVAARGGLDEIPGVGTAIAEKLREYLRDGRIPYRDRLAQEIPPGVVAFLQVPGLGPKTARRLWIELGLIGPAEVIAAIDAGRLADVKGFGPTKIAQLRTSLGQIGPSTRLPLWEATRIAESLAAQLRAFAPIERLEIAGSYRRGRESVGDLDLLVTSGAPEAVFDRFERLPEVGSVRLRGPTKETVLLSNGVQVDLRVVPPASFGAALQYFTGSKDHNVRIRTRARDLGLKVNEYGVYRDDHLVAGATEAEVYGSLGLREIPPELRENRGEIDAAAIGPLSPLVATEDLRGDLHVHPPEGADPAPTLGRFRAVAAELGHAYLGVVFRRGDLETVFPRWRAALAASPSGPTVLWGLELEANDPAPPASPEGIGYRLLSGRAGTTTPASALPAVLAIVHLALSDDALGAASPARLAPWLASARTTGTALEVTARAAQDGLDSATARMAVEAEVPILISGGAPEGPDPARLGVAVKLARRAGLGPRAIVNTSSEPLAGIRSPRTTPTRRPGRTAR